MSESPEEARKLLEKLTADLLRKIANDLAPLQESGVGFALFLFDYGAKGNFAYASTGKREDVIRAIREWLAKVEH